ncbi:MAG: DUF4124 domain-containing protein [Nitrococcus sp.]|nr:DUF4124 domain-containing protein [Nitrococcus sp.]
MIIRSALLFMLGFCLASAAAAGGQFYKWVDAQGRVHYSDAVPPQAAGQQREVKSQSGQTLQTIAPPPTRQQLAAKRRAHEAALQAEQHLRAQKEYDRTLLLTFSSVQEMKTARDERLRAITAQMKLTQERTDKLQARLQAQRRKALHIERTGASDPTPVYAEIAQLQRHIDANGIFIERQLQEQERIRRQFARDMARYRELMAAGGKSAASRSTSLNGRSGLPAPASQ